MKGMIDIPDFAQRIHRSAVVIDTHADTPQRFVDDQWDFTSALNGGHLNLDTARRGNLAAEFFAIWPEPTQWSGRYAQRTLSLIDGVLDQVRRHPTLLQLCLSSDNILAARAANRFAVLMGIEGGHAIENSIDLLHRYYHLGVRYMTLTWSNSNDWAESSGDLRAPSGLSPFGQEVIQTMNSLGMMIDVSHASDATLSDVLAITRAPILASHSSARALTDSTRNLSDTQLRAIARTGGAVMVNFFPAFIDETWRQGWNAQAPDRQEAHQALAREYAAKHQPIPYTLSNQIDREFAARLPRAPFRSLIDHIDHVARIAGIDHVGIGTDFDGIPSTPQGIDSADDLPRITAALADRGYSASDLHKLLGGNLLRVFREVQAAAD
jgi:membrane dipeptidase